jgi:alpha-mannosidase
MIQSASELNAPVLDSLPAFEPLVSLTDVTGVPVVDWIKPADDGSGDVIARVYEAAGGHAVATLGLNADLAQASVIETDVLERNQLSSDEPLALKGATEEPRNPIPAQGALVELGPYQLATLRLHTASFKG